jgi:hypothetical protein
MDQHRRSEATVLVKMNCIDFDGISLNRVMTSISWRKCPAFELHSYRHPKCPTRRGSVAVSRTKIHATMIAIGDGRVPGLLRRGKKRNGTTILAGRGTMKRTDTATRGIPETRETPGRLHRHTETADGATMTGHRAAALRQKRMDATTLTGSRRRLRHRLRHRLPPMRRN